MPQKWPLPSIPPSIATAHICNAGGPLGLLGLALYSFPSTFAKSVFGGIATSKNPTIISSHV